MLLHWSPRSPFVRKVMIVVHEKGLIEKVKTVRTVVAVDQPNPDLLGHNPLNKIPTLVLADGTALFDSRVICEYLDQLDGQPSFFPATGSERWLALRRQSLGDGLLDLLLQFRHERNRAAEQQNAQLLAAFSVKLEASLAALESEASVLSKSSFNIGPLTIGCSLSYLDFRFPDRPWRPEHPQLAAWHHQFFANRSAVQATQPVTE